MQWKSHLSHIEVVPYLCDHKVVPYKGIQVGVRCAIKAMSFKEAAKRPGLMLPG
jgi:hypothetical protein